MWFVSRLHGVREALTGPLGEAGRGGGESGRPRGREGALILHGDHHVVWQRLMRRKTQAPIPRRAIANQTTVGGTDEHSAGAA